VVSDPGATPAALDGTMDNEFRAADPDIDSISTFITQYVRDNNRWTSPKYVLGESYGKTRGRPSLTRGDIRRAARKQPQGDRSCRRKDGSKHSENECMKRKR
jgi:hypothetical protein